MLYFLNYNLNEMHNIIQIANPISYKKTKCIEILPLAWIPKSNSLRQREIVKV